MKHVLLVLCLAVSVLAQLPPVPNAEIVTLTPEPGYTNEPSIAIDPQNPQRLVTAWQTNASAAYTRDGGVHWTIAQGTAPADYRVSGDVSVAYDAQGRAFLCYIAFDKLGTPNYWAHNATRNGIFVRRSPDGGATWDPPSMVIAHPSDPGIPFEDKPYIVADNTRSPYSGNIYVGWTQFTLTKSVILFARSTDAGRSWSKPIEISTHEGLPRDDNGSVEGFTGTVAPDGTLYVVWADGNDIVFTRSRDGGRTFEPSRAILHNAPPYFEITGVSRSNGFPQIAWGPCRAAGPGCSGGLLYVTWSDYRNGDVDIFAATSSDGGRHWSPAQRVNSDSLHNGADQFFQWLAVDRHDGSANVVFYDRRGDTQNRTATMVLARSLDGGRTWSNFGWTEKPFGTHGEFLGDYTGIAAQDGQVFAAWAEEVGVAAPGSSAPAYKTVLRVGRATFGK